MFHDGLLTHRVELNSREKTYYLHVFSVILTISDSQHLK